MRQASALELPAAATTAMLASDSTSTMWLEATEKGPPNDMWQTPCGVESESERVEVLIAGVGGGGESGVGADCGSRVALRLRGKGIMKGETCLLGHGAAGRADDCEIPVKGLGCCYDGERGEQEGVGVSRKALMIAVVLP
eukprot:2445157-Pleurochrysis_carterae.AAC.2